MAKKFNADSAFEPIEITIGGKDYVMTSISEGLLDQVTEAGKKAKDGGETKVLSVQLGLFLDVPAETFKDVDVRKLAAAVKFIGDEISAAAEGPRKNA